MISATIELTNEVFMGHVVPNNQYQTMPCSKDEFRAGIFNLQDVMLEMEGRHIEPSVKHHFSEGSYGREMEIPAGAVIVGKIHKHSHINVISKGTIKVWTEYDVVTYEAPITFVSKPLTKRLVKAMTDTVWTTIHVTAETDLDKIENEVITDSYEGLEWGGV